jgi:anti-sigma regulatory factor (Ser/Thr protein kinase)
MTDEIRLVLPAEEDFHAVAHLVVGGLGARHQLTLEQLEDIQVALDALLGCREDDGEIVLTVRVEDEGVRAEVGPFAAGALAELEGEGLALGLRRVLETVCDAFEIEERDAGSWVQLLKRTETAPV